MAVRLGVPYRGLATRTARGAGAAGPPARKTPPDSESDSEVRGIGSSESDSEAAPARYAGASLSPRDHSKSGPAGAWLQSPKAADRVLAAWHGLAPVSEWLDTHVGPSTLPPEDAEGL